MQTQVTIEGLDSDIEYSISVSRKDVYRLFDLINYNRFRWPPGVMVLALPNTMWDAGRRTVARQRELDPLVQVSQLHLLPLYWLKKPFATASGLLLCTPYKTTDAGVILSQKCV